MQAKIDKAKLIQLMNEGKSYNEMASFFQVHPRSIGKAIEGIKQSSRTVPVKVDGIANDNIDAMKQLNQINASIIDALHRCNKLILRADSKVDKFFKISDKLETATDDNEKKELKKQLDEMSDGVNDVLKVQNNMINISGEARKQIELQIKIAETLYNVQMAQEFQAEIIDAIKSVDQFTAKKIIDKLKERRALRGLTKLVG
jgi:hypothetical protein